MLFRSSIQNQKQETEADPIEIIKGKIASLADSQDKKRILDEVNSLLSQLKSKKLDKIL